jgi:hypothetical protein
VLLIDIKKDISAPADKNLKKNLDPHFSGYRVENFLAKLFGIELLGQISQRSWSSTLSFHFWILLNCVALLTLVSFSVRIMKKVITINFTKPIRSDICGE